MRIKDISKLKQKDEITGNERIPVSKDEFITVGQLRSRVPQPVPYQQDNFVLVRADATGGYDPADKRYHFRISIGNFSEELTDVTKYRLCYMYTRRAKGKIIVDGKPKKRSRGIKWTVPMFGCLLGGMGNASLEDTFIPVAGKKNDVALLSGSIVNGNDLFTNNAGFTRFKLTQNTRWRTGIALFRYTGEGVPGWWRCSNIFGLELCVGNRKAWDVREVNTTWIIE